MTAMIFPLCSPRLALNRDYMGYSEEVNATGKGNRGDYITVFYGWIIKLSIRAIS